MGRKRAPAFANSNPAPPRPSEGTPMESPRNVSRITAPGLTPPILRGRQWREYPMFDRTDLVTIATAVSLAGYAAMALWYVALFDIGLTREGVRIGATVAAILLGAVVAIDFLVSKLGKRKLASERGGSRQANHQ